MTTISRGLSLVVFLLAGCPGPTGGPTEKGTAGGTSPKAHSPAGVGAARDAVLASAPPEYAAGVAALMEKPANIPAALAAFQRVLKIKPGHREARLNAAFCFIRLGRLTEAEAHYREAAASGDREALLGLADVLLRQGRASETMTMLDAWLEKHPQDLEMLCLAAEAARRSNAPDRALARVQQVLKANRTNAEGHVQFGLLFLHRKDARTALMVFGRGLVHHPKHARLILGRGLAWLAQGEMGRAVMDFEEAVKLDGSLLTGRLLLGKVYIDNLDFDGAERHYAAVLEAWPRHVEAMLGRARSLFGKKLFREALAGYQAVVATHGELPLALFQIGKIYQDHLDSASNALIYYRRFVRAEPGLSKDDPVFGIMRMLESMGGARARPTRTPDGPSRGADQGGGTP